MQPTDNDMNRDLKRKREEAMGISGEKRVSGGRDGWTASAKALLQRMLDMLKELARY